jgi:hypothetical protein
MIVLRRLKKVVLISDMQNFFFYTDERDHAPLV